MLPKAKSTSFFRLVYNAISDRTLIILIVAAFVSIGVGIYETIYHEQQGDKNFVGSWVEGLAIIVAGLFPVSNCLQTFDPLFLPTQPKNPNVFLCLSLVVIVVMVNSVNDWQKEKQFRKLNAKKEDRQIQVIRGGEQQQVSIFDVVVGELVILNYGEVIPADGVLVSGHSEWLLIDRRWQILFTNLLLLLF